MQPMLLLFIQCPADFRSVRITVQMTSSASTLALSTDDESESEVCWLHPGVSPPGDAVLQLDDESNSAQESGCMLSSKSTQTKESVLNTNLKLKGRVIVHLPDS